MPSLFKMVESENRFYLSGSFLTAIREGRIKGKDSDEWWEEALKLGFLVEAEYIYRKLGISDEYSRLKMSDFHL